MTDPITNMHGATDESNTNKRGATKIDFVGVSIDGRVDLFFVNALFLYDCIE